MQPSPEEIQEWQEAAAKRNSILPYSMNIKGRYVDIICGNDNCSAEFTRKMLPGRNEPVFVCPGCNIRNYVPIEW